MPVFLCIISVPPLIALLIALKTSGKKRILAWGIFALMALPLAVGEAGGLLLAAYGLAWRSCVKLPVGFAYVAGILALLVWAGVFLWREVEWWRPVTRAVGRCFIFAATGLLVLAAGWYGLLFSAIWAGSDRVTEYNGQTVVAEQTFMNRDYYACHGPLVRGRDILGHSN